MKEGNSVLIDGDKGKPLLNIKGISVNFHTPKGVVEAVNDVSFSIMKGGTLGIVGESGSGKTVLAKAVLGVVEKPGKVDMGDITFKGRSLLNLTDEEMRDIRGKEISYIPQEPVSALNPVITIGEQIAEVIRVHEYQGGHIPWGEKNLLFNLIPRFLKIRNMKAWEKAVDLLGAVGINPPEARAEEYPHQFSGGMNQRAIIAAAISCEPDLLIADEPTTALDVTIEAQILELLEELRKETGISIIWITHDIGLIGEFCENIIVMYAGKVVEAGKTREVLTDPYHPYTQGLIKSMPDISKKGKELFHIEGELPNPIRKPHGCYFEPRCPFSFSPCKKEYPPETSIDQRSVYCYKYIKEEG